MATAPKTKAKARVLVACVIDGKPYRPDDLLVASADVVKQAEQDGKVDSHPDAVKHVEKG